MANKNKNNDSRRGFEDVWAPPPSSDLMNKTQQTARPLDPAKPGFKD